MRAYPSLTEGQRNQIYALKEAEFSQCAIAEQAVPMAWLQAIVGEAVFNIRPSQIDLFVDCT